MTYKLGEFLRSLRGKESLRSVSERSNNKLSHSYISDIEKGVSRRGNEVKPSPETLKTLSEVYNTDYNYLMKLAGYLENEEPPKKINDLNVLDSKDNNLKLIASHIDDDVTEEDMEDILKYIELIKKSKK
ncbi:MAG: helix-turn-helix transcriptional regulator [Vagococcus sp.]|jgi:transcriptional regulator with XRE-family HTH domain|uniref:Helix-turn-helix family protein n=1 Tax=Carnobacterium maltaromaticum LMA28 TaxID=1234679 RepID=K8E4F2_CARML|nr:helix-turn-helix transcriptional regulator [Carnobacterium maltaromaticum]CCO11330.2 helix-turn-helix family protein [Carnobacterium maltaromaticum LMA28]